jgi:DNA-binding transcriptional ArsR family regulator
MNSVAALDFGTFAALGEPNRLRIVAALRNGPLTVGELVEQLALRQPQVSKHLKVLAASGIVGVEIRHRFRIYHLEKERFEAIARWVESFETLWEARLDSLGALLYNIANEGDEHGNQAR